MKHALRVHIVTQHPQRLERQWVQTIDDEQFDPEHRGELNLAAAAWDELVANTDLGILLRDVAMCPSEYGEDDRVHMTFDTVSIADEYLIHVGIDYFDGVPAR